MLDGGKVARLGRIGMTRDHLEAFARTLTHDDHVVVEAGDMVCLHTGFARELVAMGGRPDERVHNMCAALDGRDGRLLRWITESGLAVLIADNYAVESVPSRPAEGGGRRGAGAPARPG